MRIFAPAGCALSAVLLVVAFAGNAVGQSYPVKSVRIVVPYPPGGRQ